jgi:diacylglycerol kinase (ATP)
LTAPSQVRSGLARRVHPAAGFAGRVAFVLNPAAGNGSAARRRPALDAAVRASGLDAEVHVTAGPDDVERLARRLAATFDAVVAVGGDGTIHDVANALAGTDTLFGALPVGTGNDFARALGMPSGVEAGVRAIATSTPRLVDVGVARWEHAGPDGALVTRERLFANCLGAGFDARAAADAARSKWLGGRAAYVAAVLRTLWAWRAPQVEVEVAIGAARRGADGSPAGEDEVVFRGPLFLCEIGNGQAVGGGFRLTPDARIDDGLLDVCVARHMPTARALRILPTAFAGAHVRFPEVSMYRTARVTVRVVGGALPVQADGEAASADARTLEAEVWPGALRVLAPAV